MVGMSKDDIVRRFRGRSRVTPIDRLLCHRAISRLAQALDERPGGRMAPQPEMRLAAIALVIRLGANGEPELLMIKRADAPRDPWSGHVACPGG